LGACSGFIYSLATGEQFIQSGKHKKVLVIGVDTMSSIVNFKDRNSCVLFGDGAGAVLLEASSDEKFGILDNVNHIDGTGAEYLYMPAGGSLNPTTHDTVEKKMHYVHQEGKAVYKYAVSEMANVSEEILKKNKIDPKELSLFVAHQANLRIIESTQKRLGLPDEKVMISIDKFANTTSATIPTCLDLAVEQKKLKKGDLVLLTAFGAGFTWGATLVRWSY
jgi:3-oxoacyl-[acyl-carrier-protein] synthase-3